MYPGTNATRGSWLGGILALALAAGCGGGSGSGGGTASPTNTTSISGKALLGPISGATAEVFALTSAGALGNRLGAGTTDASGAYQIAIDPPSGPIAVRITGSASASYRDEATGTTMAFTADDSLLAYCPSAAGTAATINVTPLTHWAALRVQQSAPASADSLSSLITQANDTVARRFVLVDILSTTPADLTDGTPDDAANAATTYGLILSALSQEAGILGASGPALVAALGTDFSADGTFDGAGMGGGSVPLGASVLSGTAATRDLSAAATAFLGGTQNASGLTSATEASLLSTLSGPAPTPAPAPTPTPAPIPNKFGLQTFGKGTFE